MEYIGEQNLFRRDAAALEFFLSIQILLQRIGPLSYAIFEEFQLNTLLLIRTVRLNLYKNSQVETNEK